MRSPTRLIGQLVLTILICSISQLSKQGRFLEISIQEAHAQSEQEDELFRALILRATQAFKSKEYLQAIDSFKRALLLRKSEYNIHWNLAVLYQKVERLEEALSHVNQFLDKERSPKRREKAEQRRNKILKAMKDAYFSPTKKAPLAKITSPPKPKTQPPPKAKPPQKIQPSPPTIAREKRESSPSKKIDDQPAVVARTSTEPRDKSWIVWTVSGLSMGVIGASLHLYANTVWQGRPQDGTRAVVDAQDTAVTSSIIGDSLLVIGTVTMLYGLYKMLSHGGDRGEGEATPGLGGQPPEGWSRRPRAPLKRSTSMSILPLSGGGSISLEYVF